tara:strand:+ start:491 stop:916 length:426 start_codon:yes stop_codon:yes gene_type:complete
MPIRKSDDIANETGDEYAKSKSSSKVANITERFNDSTDNDNPFDDALQYVNKKIDECIDVVNDNDEKTGISNVQSAAITANTNKATFPFTPLKTITGFSTINITHKLNKLNGSHELLLTVTIPPTRLGAPATFKSTTLPLK